MDQFAYQSGASDREFSDPESLEESIQHGNQEPSNQQAARAASASFQLPEDILPRASARFQSLEDILHRAVPTRSGEWLQDTVTLNRMLRQPLRRVIRDQRTHTIAGTIVHRRVRRNQEHRRRILHQFLHYQVRLPGLRNRHIEIRTNMDIVLMVRMTYTSGRSLLSFSAFPRSIGSSSPGDQETRMGASYGDIFWD